MGESDLACRSSVNNDMTGLVVTIYVRPDVMLSSCSVRVIIFWKRSRKGTAWVDRFFDVGLWALLGYADAMGG